MAKLGIVMCRLCGKRDIDRNTQKENVDWVMRSKNYFYHKKCFDEWVQGQDQLAATKNDELWMDYGWAYLQDEKHIELNYGKFSKQWKTFMTQKMTSKGIYFCLRYFYDVYGGDASKSKGGIGIVPYMYSESTQYWIAREERECGILERIERQLKEKSAQKVLKVAPKPKPKKRQTISLDDI